MGSRISVWVYLGFFLFMQFQGLIPLLNIETRLICKD